MGKLNITEGEWEIKGWRVFSGEKEILELKPVSRGLAIGLMNIDYQASDNAKIILDASATYKQCQKLSSQLLHENKELFEFLERAVYEIRYLKSKYKDKDCAIRFLELTDEIIDKLK